MTSRTQTPSSFERCLSEVLFLFLFKDFSPLLEVCHLLPVGRFTSVSSLVRHLFDALLYFCCLISTSACDSPSSWLHKTFHLVLKTETSLWKVLFPLCCLLLWQYTGVLSQLHFYKTIITVLNFCLYFCPKGIILFLPVVTPFIFYFLWWYNQWLLKCI